MGRAWLRDKGIYMQVVQLGALMAIGDTEKLKKLKRKPNMQVAVTLFGELTDMFGDKRARRKRMDKTVEQANANIEPIGPDEAAYVAQAIMKARQEYADSRTAILLPDPAVDPDALRGGRAEDS